MSIKQAGIATIAIIFIVLSAGTLAARYIAAKGAAMQAEIGNLTLTVQALGTAIGKIENEQTARVTSYADSLNTLRGDVIAATQRIPQFLTGRDALLGAYTAEPITLQEFDDNPRHLDNNGPGDGNSNTIGKTVVDCPTWGRVAVLLIAGQSNAGNYASERFIAPPTVANFNVYDGRCYAAADPLLGTSGTGGNFATLLGADLVKRGHFDAVIVVPIAIGGTYIRQWIPDGIMHRRLLVAIERLRRANLTITHVLWQQGEADHQIASGAAYLSMFEDIFLSIRRYGVFAPIYVAISTYCGQANAEITKAQHELPDAARGILPGPDTDIIGEPFRADNCHFNGQGARLQATFWRDALVVRSK